MKKQICSLRILAVIALFVVSFSLNAQTGENPKQKTKPQGSSQPTQPQPPIQMPQPIMVPGPIFYPPSMPQNNMGVAPAKTQAEIAQENRENARIEVIKELYQLNADIQNFEITDVTKPFHVKGTKGFKIQFPEFAFVDEDGNPVMGEVQIKMTEYTSFSEFAAAGLSTMTTNGEILETGGMINLEAQSGGKKIKLADGKQIKITVPNVDPNKDFQTYYGSGTDQIKWSTTPQQNDPKTDTEPYDGYTIKMLKPSGHVHGDNIAMTFYKNQQALDEYVNASLKVSNDVKKKILKDGIPFVYSIEFNALGKIKSVAPKNRELTDKTLISSMNTQIVSLLKNAPAFDMTEGGLMAGKPYDIIFATTKNYTGNQVKFSAPLAFPVNAKSENKVDEKPTDKNVQEFTMNSTTLQKINCDRLSGYASTDTATFHFDRADAMIYIVIKDMRAMISPNGANGDYYMTKIPAGTPVRYVAVVYDDEGNVHISTNNTNFTKGKVEFIDRIPFSSITLRQALEGQ